MKSSCIQAILFVLLFSCQNTNKSVPLKPNILLFLADDLTWHDVEPYGSQDVKTPYIAQLAADGLVFDNMYTATAMCAPTRQQLYTGQYPVKNGAFPNHSRVYEGVKSLGHYFQEIGYNVALIGKQHYGPPESFPFIFLGGNGSDDGSSEIDIDLELINPIVENEKPFFLIIAQNQPHRPWTRGNSKLYHPDSLDVPEYLIDNEKSRIELTKYYAEITYMDSLFGVSRQIIDRAGKSENTLTIFTSEQGAALPFAKWTCYEQGLKTGFIISWENHIRNGRSKALTQYVDVVPTLLDLVGASNEMSSLDRAFDGISFLDVIQGNEVSKRKYIYGVQTSRGISNGPESYPIRSVSDGTFKLIHNLESETTFTNNLTVKNWSYAESNSHENVVRYQNRPEYEFYNLKIDPFEQDNLINNTVYLNKITELKQSLSTWMISQNDFGVETELKALNRMNY